MEFGGNDSLGGNQCSYSNAGSGIQHDRHENATNYPDHNDTGEWS
jgi:hypothetical protein